MELTSENSWSGRISFVSAMDRSVYLRKSTNFLTEPAQYVGPAVVFWMEKRWSQMGFMSGGLR